jgi:hypothetical protein
VIDLLKTWPVGEPVPAISLMQPWASAVADYGKDCENRSKWPFKHRGPIIIHASRTRPYMEDFEEFKKIAKEDGWTDEDLSDIAEDSYPLDLFPHGCIVGVANLAEYTPRKTLRPPITPCSKARGGFPLPAHGCILPT